jgi:hypothetical protein
MDPAPRPFDELPRDPELGVPVPFACGTAEFGGSTAEPPTVRQLDHRRVTQCALSRVCGVCGAGLGRPLAFLGSRAESNRNAFHFPASHVECARSLLGALREVTGPILGQADAEALWVLATAPAFEFVRPNREDQDRRPTFQPQRTLDESEVLLEGQSVGSPARSAGRGPL